MEKKMTCVEWTKLLGSTTEDAKFLAVLKENGIVRVPRPDSSNKTVGGITLSFCDPLDIRTKIVTTKKTSAAFFGMMVHLSDLKSAKDLYTGPLPFKIKSSDTLKALTEKLGKPTSQNAKDARFRWKMADFDLIAFYEKDLEQLKAISFVLPYA